MSRIYVAAGKRVQWLVCAWHLEQGRITDKIIPCIDCKCDVILSPRGGLKTNRCEACRVLFNKERAKEYSKNYYQENKEIIARKAKLVRRELSISLKKYEIGYIQ